MDELRDYARASTSKRVTNALVQRVKGHCLIFGAAQNDQRANVLLTYLLGARSDNDDCTETQIILVMGIGIAGGRNPA